MSKFRAWPAEPTTLESDDPRFEGAWTPLLEACEARFPAPEFTVECDAKHTVWVKHVSEGRSVGLSSWMLRTRSLEQLLDGVESRLAKRVASE